MTIEMGLVRIKEMTAEEVRGADYQEQSVGMARRRAKRRRKRGGGEEVNSGTA